MDGSRRSYTKLLLSLPPDAVALIYLYFVFLLYVSAAALRFIYHPEATPEDMDAAANAAPVSTEIHTGFFWWPATQVSAHVMQLKASFIQLNGHSTRMVIVGMFLVSLGLPTVLMVAITATNPASATISRPAKYMRPTVSNFLVLAATVAEALQLSASTFQV